MTDSDPIMIPILRDDYEEHILHQRCLAGLKYPVPCVALCPAGVDIPKNFALYNQFKLDGRATHLLGTYDQLGTDRQATQCVRCDACVPLCPQHIAIPDRLEEVARAVAASRE